jgi:hypothetical protein
VTTRWVLKELNVGTKRCLEHVLNIRKAIAISDFGERTVNCDETLRDHSISENKKEVRQWYATFSLYQTTSAINVLLDKFKSDVFALLGCYAT